MTPRRPLTRRAMLLGAGGLAAGAGAGLTVALTPSTAAAATARLRTDEADPPPGEDLMREHGLLLRILLVYRYAAAQIQEQGQVSAAPLHAAATIVHTYIEGFHEPLEEGYVFPRLRQAGQLTSTIGILLQQHARGRQLTQEILAATSPGAQARGPAARSLSSALTAFARMYEPHEAREDTVIYPAFRALLAPAEIVTLGQHFAALERARFGPGGFTTMVTRVATIEQALGRYDLSQFTPPAPPSG